MNSATLLDKALDLKRLSRDEGLYLLKHAEWTDLVKTAHQVRLKKHPANQVSYTVFRLINYTNVCDVGCSFCSFQDKFHNKKQYVLSTAEIRSKAEAAIAEGADQIFFQGGVHVDIPLDYYVEQLNLLNKEMGLHVRGFSPVELFRIAAHQGLSVPELLVILKEAGLGSVPGAGAEILTESMRQKLSPQKLSATDWCQVMGDCHEAGLPGSANIVFGSDETPEDILDHMNYIRQQQDKTKGFLTFVPWVFQPQTKDFFIRHVRGDEYLKLLALSRLFFDNIEHIEVSILVMGKELGELGLYAGADDINSPVLEENVLRSSGLKSIAAAESFIAKAGFKARRRSLNFEFTKYAG
jgi:cyclic dehypoxanthinyl futalosine synthase